MLKQKKLDNGIIEYKLPNIAEILILIGEMGYSTNDLLNFSNSSNEGDVSPEQLIFSGKLIQKIEPFVTRVEIKDDSKLLKSYSDLVQNFKFIPLLNEIGMEILSALEVSEEKKS